MISKDDISPQKVADNLRRQCSKREYCEADVRKKVFKLLGGDKQQADKIVSELVKEKYVDDRRYAEAFVRDKSSLSGWGVAKIRYMLGMKGVRRDIIEDALKEIDLSKASSKLERLLENKCRSLLTDPQCKLKLLRYGLGRGYSYEELEPLITRLLRELKSEI